MMKWKAAILAAVLVLSMPVQADNNEALFELLEALYENGTIDAKTYAAIKATADRGKRVQAEPEPETTRSAASNTETRELIKEEIAATERDKPKINTKGKFEVTSADEDFKFRIGGRLLVDAATHDSDITDLGDGSEVRRARLFVQGTLWQVWNYKFEYDFTNSGAEGINDAYLAYTGFKPVTLQGGHFKEPFSLQNLTSSKYVNFIERALPQAFAPGRNIGIAARSGSDHWSAAAGLFGESITNPGDDIDGGYGLTGRLTYAPVNTGDRVVHLGGALGYRKTDQNNQVRFRERPESHVTDMRFVDTNFTLGAPIDADDIYRYGLEGGAVYGPFAMQGEYIGVSVNRRLATNPDLDFQGYYAEATWFLTDDQLNYSGKDGAFKAVNPGSIVGRGGIGAWQLGIRFSSIDLNDADISGGEEDNLTLGLNWFPNANLRFSANYIKVLDTEGGPVPGDEPDILTVRGQLEF